MPEGERVAPPPMLRQPETRARLKFLEQVLGRISKQRVVHNLDDRISAERKRLRRVAGVGSRLWRECLAKMAGVVRFTSLWTSSWGACSFPVLGLTTGALGFIFLAIMSPCRTSSMGESSHHTRRTPDLQPPPGGHCHPPSLFFSRDRAPVAGS